MEYYIEGESKMEGRHFKDTNKKTNKPVNKWNNCDILQKQGDCKLNSWNKKDSFLWKSKVKNG